MRLWTPSWKNLFCIAYLDKDFFFQMLTLQLDHWESKSPCKSFENVYEPRTFLYPDAIPHSGINEVFASSWMTCFLRGYSNGGSPRSGGGKYEVVGIGGGRRGEDTPTTSHCPALVGFESSLSVWEWSVNCDCQCLCGSSCIRLFNWMMRFVFGKWE